MSGWIQDMLGIKDEDLHKPMWIRTKITIDSDTLEKMAHAFGKGMRGDSLTSEERHYVKEIEKNPRLKQIVEGEYKMIEDGRDGK